MQAEIHNPEQYSTSEETLLTLDDVLVLDDIEHVVIYGTNKQRSEMFKEWACYIGEVKNPENNATNPYFGSLYSPLDEVLNNSRPVLGKYGFGLFQAPTYKDGVVSIQTILSHKSGAFISFPLLSIPIAKKDAQGIIAGVTYARRGALNPQIGTHGENDDDGNEAADPKREKKVIEDPLASKKADILSIAEELRTLGVSKDVINKTTKENCGVLNFNTVTEIEKLNKTYEALSALKKGNK
jgi:hypothetical protein